MDRRLRWRAPPCKLVGDGQELQGAEIGGLVEEESRWPRPARVRAALSQVAGGRGDANPVALLRAPETQSLSSWHRRWMLTKERGEPAIAAAGTSSGELSEASPDVLLGIGAQRWFSALSGTGFAQQSARPALGDPVSLFDLWTARRRRAGLRISLSHILQGRDVEDLVGQPTRSALSLSLAERWAASAVTRFGPHRGLQIQQGIAACDECREWSCR